MCGLFSTGDVTRYEWPWNRQILLLLRSISLFVLEKWLSSCSLSVLRNRLLSPMFCVSEPCSYPNTAAIDEQLLRRCVDLGDLCLQLCDLFIGSDRPSSGSKYKKCSGLLLLYCIGMYANTTTIRNWSNIYTATKSTTNGITMKEERAKRKLEHGREKRRGKERKKRELRADEIWKQTTESR